MKADKAKDEHSDEKSAPSKETFWGGRMDEAPEEMNVSFCAGRDVATRPMADAVLIPFDIWQNRVHSIMLTRAGITPPEVLQKILSSLDEFEEQTKSGKLQLDPRKEDVHTNIEHFVAEKATTAVSGFMHTGRSRNDQSATVVRMYLRQNLLQFSRAMANVVQALLDSAEAHAEVPLTGFTHYQPASLTTIGHWLASHAQALIRDLDRLQSCYERINISPLGAAASFGTSWPIDRKLTANLLGFRSVQANTLDCITNRWEMEADVANCISFAMTHLSILAQDIIVLSAPYLAILRVADRYVTGSSIMPQKRNPDFAEVTRAKTVLIQNLTNSLFGMARGALSGYNRDTQWTKYVIMDIFDEAMQTPDIFAGVVRSMKVDENRTAAFAKENFVDAVDVADALSRVAGLPFRAAYDIVSKAVRLSEGQGRINPDVVAQLTEEAGHGRVNLAMEAPETIIAAKTHVGAPAPEALRRDLKPMKEELSLISNALISHADELLVAQRKTEEMAEKLIG